MQNIKRTPFKKCIQAVLLAAGLCLCLASFNSCSSFRAMNDFETPASFKIEWPSWMVTKVPSPWRAKVEIPSSDDKLNRVGILVFEDVSQQQPPEIRNYFNNVLPNIIAGGCRNLLLAGGQSAAILSADALPRLITGDIDNYALADAGRSLGLNTIIIGRLMQVGSAQHFTGYAWWRKPSYYLTFDFRMEVYDTVSAVKLIDGSGRGQVEIDENRYQIIQQNGGKVPMELLMPEFDRFVQKEMVPAICAASNAIPWQAGIRGNGQSIYTIPGAGVTGLVVGDALDVYSHGYTIQGIAGERFWYQGPVTGLARVINVTPELIEIEILEGSTRFEFGVVSKKMD